MNQATWLQDRRMQKFRDVLSRWERGEVSMLKAGELLGMSERQFRRYRDRYKEAGLRVVPAGWGKTVYGSSSIAYRTVSSARRLQTSLLDH